MRLALCGLAIVSSLFCTSAFADVRYDYDALGRLVRVVDEQGRAAVYVYGPTGNLLQILREDAPQGPPTITSVGPGLVRQGQARQVRLVGTNLLGASVTPPDSSLAVYVEQASQNWNGAALSYDDNGNLLADGARTYSWDARNRLVGISGAVSAAFTYDATGRRLSKSVNGASTEFVYDGLNPVQERSGGAPVANLLTGSGIDEFFRRTDATGARDFMTDALGSTLALTDSAGAVRTSYSYDPYGNVITTGDASSNSFQYTGRENDDTGLYFYRARFYHPGLQRFISEDPLGVLAGINFYAYADANPISRVDPLGLASLVYDSGTLTVYDRNGQAIASYPAGNNTTNPAGDPYTVGSNGPAPSGIFPVQPPINTAGQREYGPYFIPIGARGPNGERLDIARERGIGIHGGRSGPQSRTQGCIRVSNDAVRDLVDVNRRDPITEIEIR